MEYTVHGALRFRCRRFEMKRTLRRNFAVLPQSFLPTIFRFLPSSLRASYLRDAISCVSSSRISPHAVAPCIIMVRTRSGYILGISNDPDARKLKPPRVVSGICSGYLIAQNFLLFNKRNVNFIVSYKKEDEHLNLKVFLSVNEKFI